MTMTVATLQLGVCAVYAIIMWIVKINPAKIFGFQLPSKQNVPKSTAGDIAKTLPVGFCSAAAHACTVFALGGDPLFGQIVKSGEPVLSALVNTIFYGKPPSNAKVACLPIIVGGVAFASLKKSAETGGYALKFDQTALVFGMMANAFAAFKGSENKKLMGEKSIADRFGGVGNQVSVNVNCVLCVVCCVLCLCFIFSLMQLSNSKLLFLIVYQYSSINFLVCSNTNPSILHVSPSNVPHRRRQILTILRYFQIIY